MLSEVVDVQNQVAILPHKFENIKEFTQGLIAGTVTLDDYVVPCEGNFKAFLESRQRLGNSGLQVVLFDLYNQFLELIANNQIENNESKNVIINKFKYYTE